MSYILSVHHIPNFEFCLNLTCLVSMCCDRQYCFLNWIFITPTLYPDTLLNVRSRFCHNCKVLFLENGNFEFLFCDCASIKVDCLFFIFSFRPLVVPYRVFTQLLYLKWLIYVILFLRLPTSLGCLRPWTFFSNNGLDKLPWTSFISDLHTKLNTISGSVPGLATDSPCGVWGLEWTACLLYDGPLLALCV